MASTNLKLICSVFWLIQVPVAAIFEDNKLTVLMQNSVSANTKNSLDKRESLIGTLKK